jgi:hypothetical protein
VSISEAMDKDKKFIGLDDETLEQLTDHQREAYNVLRDTCEELAAAETAASAASVSLHAASDGLRAAQEADRLAPKHSFLDEHRLMIQQRKIDRGLAPAAMAAVAQSGDGAPPPKPGVREHQRWHAECLQAYRQANERQLVARGRRNLALRDWQNATMQTITPEQLIRSHIDAETQLRADVKEGRVSPRKSPDQPGPSKIDQFAYYTKNQGRGAGGGSSFRRGGKGQNELLRQQAEQAFRAKQSTGA